MKTNRVRKKKNDVYHFINIIMFIHYIEFLFYYHFSSFYWLCILSVRDISGLKPLKNISSFHLLMLLLFPRFLRIAWCCVWCSLKINDQVTIALIQTEDIRGTFQYDEEIHVSLHFFIFSKSNNQIKI